MANICNQTNEARVALEEDEESEYSYVYETDSEYEYEYEEEEEGEIANASETNKTDTVAVDITDDTNPPVASTDKVDLLDDDENTALQKHKQQLEKFKPKLPAYITSPEPCAFSEDPGRWIAWMEEEVNKEKERRMQKLIEESQDQPEVEPEATDTEEENFSVKMEVDPASPDENSVMDCSAQENCENDMKDEENICEDNSTLKMQIRTKKK